MPGTRTLLLAAILLVPAFGCSPARAPATGRVALLSPHAELVAEHQAAARQAQEQGVIGAIADRFAASGIYVAAFRQGTRGPAAARGWLERDTLNRRSTARWQVVRLEVSANGQDGYSYGYLDLVRPDGSVAPGAYHAYWRRNASGQWQILAMGRGRRELGPGALSLDTTALARRAPWRGPPADSVRTLADLFVAERAFSDSAATSIPAAFQGFASPDAGKIAGAAYVFGPAAIAGIFRDPFPVGLQWEPQAGTVAGSGDLGFTLGPAGPRRPQAGAPAGGGGVYFTVWGRLADGRWRYLVD